VESSGRLRVVHFAAGIAFLLADIRWVLGWRFCRYPYYIRSQANEEEEVRLWTFCGAAALRAVLWTGLLVAIAHWFSILPYNIVLVLVLPAGGSRDGA